jgi:hypothetical protein
MGFSRGPNIVRDGLVLGIDPASSRSYPGSGTTLKDLSPRNNNMTVSNSNLLQTSSPGYEIRCNGANAYTDVISDLDTDFHTICMLFKFTGNGTYPNGTTGSWNKVFEYSPTGDRSPGIWRYPGNLRLHWTYNPGNTSTNFGATGVDTDFSLNTKYYIVMRKDGSNTHFWVNGIKYSGITNCANPKESGSARIYFPDSYNDGLMTIWNVQVYNRAITDSEAVQNYNAFKARLVN